MRHVVLHYHIYKNAGCTVDAILKKNFTHADIEGVNHYDTVDAQELLQFVLAHPHLKAISSHTTRLPGPCDQNVMFHPLVFLRHPIDRVGSVYSFERQVPANTHQAGNIARETNFREYVRWRLVEGNGPTITNFQTIYLSGRERDMRTAVATKSDLETALERLNVLGFVGIVELFDDSIRRMQSYLSPYFSVDTSFEVENRSADRKETLEERIEEIEIALGPNLYAELLDRNALDLELYKKARLLYEE